MNARPPPHLDGLAEEGGWTKDRKLRRGGFADLEYLPKGRSAWNGTLSAYAYSARRALAGRADLNLWAAMHALPASARYEQLGKDALVCWHGTSAARAEKIGQLGLFHRGGVWAAVEPTIAHSYTRSRSRRFGAGSAMIVFVISKDQWDTHASPRGPSIVEFHRKIPRDCIEYILYSDRLESVGLGKARRRRPWGTARFKRVRGRWVPRSRPPVRLGEKHNYSDFDGWLELSVRRILQALGKAAAIELFSSLYATVDPWNALEHRQIFDTLERLCGKARPGPHSLRVFSLRERE